MTSPALSASQVKIAFPTLRELREMLSHPAVAITAAICVTLLALGALAGVVFLTYTGHDAAVIGTLITVGLAAVGTLLHTSIKRTVNDAVNKREG